MPAVSPAPFMGLQFMGPQSTVLPGARRGVRSGGNELRRARIEIIARIGPIELSGGPKIAGGKAAACGVGSSWRDPEGRTSRNGGRSLRRLGSRGNEAGLIQRGGARGPLFRPDVRFANDATIFVVLFINQRVEISTAHRLGIQPLDEQLGLHFGYLHSRGKQAC